MLWLLANMRSVSILLLALHACVALIQDEASQSMPLSPMIPEHILEEIWENAANEYRKNVFQQFQNGSAQSHSRRRRGTKSTPFSEMFDEYSNILDIYTDKLSKKHNITKRQAAGTQNPAQCSAPATSHCNNFINWRFRTVDGTCNNVNNLVWGATNRALNRMLQPAYEDGFNAPRGGLNSRLQNPRVISTTVHPDNTNALNRRITNMVPQFGQFLDHDITLTPEANSQCCANPNSNPANCWPISVAGDAFYSRFGSQCIDFTRSTPCIRNGVREQMNGNTAFIDGSQIYGSNAQRANALRTMQGGLLRTNPSFQGFLPFGNNLGVRTQGDFVAGDDRVNEMPGLSVMQNVWLMEHNRIATQFQRLTNWNDERIYQETRRIVAAELQQIAYNEYLPIILGPSAMQEYDLQATTWSTYNNQIDPTITNEFATAAYRFGHSLISGVVQMFNSFNQVVGSFLVADEYFQSKQITRDNGQGYDLILRGLMRQNAPEMDRFVTTGVTNFLFKPQNQAFGSDLVARNIQRGRDHGLRSYNDYRVSCGLSDLSAATWSVVPPGITGDGWAQAARVYRRPIDIDLFVGGLIEIPVAGGLSGNTFTCLKATQFSRLKFGDRYFFTHNLNTGFNANQLENIVQRRLSDVICDNSQQPNTQSNVFLVEGSGNPSVQCGAGRPQIDVNLFV